MVLQTPGQDPHFNLFTPRPLNGPQQQNVVTTGDFDGDGRPDVAAASTGTSDVTIVLNSRAGMTTRVYSTNGSSARGIVAVDLDRDGALDVVTANRGTSTLEVLDGKGDGTFAAAVASPPDGKPRRRRGRLRQRRPDRSGERQRVHPRR